MKSLRKKLAALCILVLAVLLCLVAGCQAFAEEDEEEEQELSVYQQLQIDLITSKLDELLQTDDQNIWYYCVMDFDHNGRLEFFAADQHPADRSINLKVWEVNAEPTDVTECTIEIDADESFPDLVTNAADTYYDRERDPVLCFVCQCL